MSHVATVEIEVKDLAAIKAACEELGLVFLEGQETFKWYGRWVNDYSANDAAYKHGIDPKDYGKCRHAIGVKGNKSAYEIGLFEKTDGSGFALVYDNWGSGGRAIEQIAGKGLGVLTQNYVKQVAKKQMLLKGYTIGGTKVKADGTIEMVFTSY